MRMALIATAVLVAALTLTALLRDFATSEPKYNGVPLHTLVLQVRLDPQSTTSRLRSLPTNALPFLVEWICYEPSAWRAHLARSILRTWRGPAALRVGSWIISTRRHDLAVGSLTAFEALGTNAAPAIPALVRLVN